MWTEQSCRCLVANQVCRHVCAKLCVFRTSCARLFVLGESSPVNAAVELSILEICVWSFNTHTVSTIPHAGSERGPARKQDQTESFEAADVSEKGGSIKVKFKRLKKADS